MGRQLARGAPQRINPPNWLFMFSIYQLSVTMLLLHLQCVMHAIHMPGVWSWKDLELLVNFSDRAKACTWTSCAMMSKGWPLHPLRSQASPVAAFLSMSPCLENMEGCRSGRYPANFSSSSLVASSPCAHESLQFQARVVRTLQDLHGFMLTSVMPNVTLAEAHIHWFSAVGSCGDHHGLCQ